MAWSDEAFPAGRYQDESSWGFMALSVTVRKRFRHPLEGSPRTRKKAHLKDLEEKFIGEESVLKEEDLGRRDGGSRALISRWNSENKSKLRPQIQRMVAECVIIFFDEGDAKLL
ncbi:hypothetical protein L1987_78537 [Smallanthus sonchifolius]|uniref:Uncharacterized protein n=1 Tax=Smallanthus sonchifolius TaxID=185202 RepID=A0ACB8ZCY1_9ASTR|nr:hypothetical protein L1987_78537 [Smallanthus sonchifolius]